MTGPSCRPSAMAPSPSPVTATWTSIVTAPDGKSALIATDMGVMLPDVRTAAEQSDFVAVSYTHLRSTVV